MMTKPLEMTKEGRPENLRLFLSFVELACQHYDVPSAVASEVKLAVEEVVSNIIHHGYRAGKAGPIVLQCERIGERMTVTISDRGLSFDPRNAVPADVDAPWETRQIGGLGWHLVKRVVDELSYETTSDGINRLVLVKRLGEGSA